MRQPSITFLLLRQGQVLRRVSFAQAVIRIGRHPGNHLQLDEEAVIKRHAIIELQADRVVLSDLTEGGALRLNGRALDEARLTVGDRLQLGSTEIVVEQIELPGVAAPLSIPPRVAAPLVVPPSFVPPPVAALARRAPAMEPTAWSVPVPQHGYALLRSGPAVRSEEVELAHVLSAEVTILWGENVLHVAHLAAGQSFHVGDEDGPDAACDFLLPREKLGVSRLPLVLARGAGFSLVIAAHAQGQLRSADGTAHSLMAVRAGAEVYGALPGARLVPLTLGTHAELQFGDLVLRVAAVRAGKPLGHGLASGLDTTALPYFALSALSVGGLLSSLAFLVPSLSLQSETESEDDRLYLLQAYLESAAEREREQEVAPAAAASAASADSGGSRAAGEEGALGNPEAAPAPRRLALAGDVPPSARQLSRSELLAEVEKTGMVGLLQASQQGLNLPELSWTAPRMQGSDELSALGGLWSDQVGEAAGNGLSMSGTGLRGGGSVDGLIGLGGLNTIGRAGNGPGGPGGPGSGGNGREGTALSAMRASGGHRTSVPRLREADTRINGRLPPDTIRRVVRQNHTRLKLCYEKGLMTNPTLSGRVNVRFVIGGEGRVTHVTEAGSDLPDSNVVRCVTRAFYDIGFPKPEGGIVTVVYPISFSPE
jgi:pSer/pThr/pTyr-binding forkhead associated (FHA) protein